MASPNQRELPEEHGNPTMRPTSTSDDGNGEDSTMGDAAQSPGFGIGGNGIQSIAASIENDHGDAERSGLSTPGLTTGPSEADDDEPITPGQMPPEYEEGDYDSPPATTSAGSDHLNQDHRSPATANPPGPNDGSGESNDSMAPTPTLSDDGNLNSIQAQSTTTVVSEQAVEDNDGAVPSDVASEEDVPAPGQEHQATESGINEDAVSDNSNVPMESSPTNTIGEGEAQEPAVALAQDIDESATDPDMKVCHGEEEVELPSYDDPLLPSEVPESPLLTGAPRNENFQASDLEQGEALTQAVTPTVDDEDTANRPGEMIQYGQEEVDPSSLEIPETPVRERGSLGEDPDNLDQEQGEIQEPVVPTAQDFEDTASEADWDFDYMQSENIQLPSEIPETPLQSGPQLGDDPLDFDLDEGETVANPVGRVSIITGYGRSEEISQEDQPDESQGGEGSIQGKQSKGGSSEFSQREASTASQAASHSSSDDSFVAAGNKDGKTVHLRIQYLVKNSKRSKAGMCVSVPANISYRAFKQAISDALHNHNGIKNPHPAHAEAVISRLLLILAKKPTDPPNFRSVVELTEPNLQQNLGLLPQRSMYDFVKVEFEPGTNGEARPSKATGRIYGRSRKVGGL